MTLASTSDGTGGDTGSGFAVPRSKKVMIRLTDVTKCYQIYEAPQDRLKQAIYPRLRKLLRRPEKKHFREFWAVKGASLEVKVGDTLGIIGRNGSGKSTLLQMICGTLTPTGGTIEVNGKVAALLELGAGFNPEFTGRENIYMNATVLGLNEAQIKSKLQDIIAFADIGDFIDQPVKIYSSGMYVRLAFAVIAHVDADILVIDEALSVGDAVFSQKCMRFLRSFRERGTLIFVSHDTSSVINLCQEALWLDQGAVRQQGTALEVANAYLKYTADEVYGDIVKLQKVGVAAEAEGAQARVDEDTRLELFDNIANSDGWTSGAAEIVSVNLSGTDQQPITVFSGGERVMLTVRAKALKEIESAIIGFFVKDRLGQSLFGEHTYTYSPGLKLQGGQVLEASFMFSLPLLPNGDYSMTVSVADGDPWVNIQHHWLHDAVLIRVSSPKLRYGLVGIPFESVTTRIAAETI
jgi:lipopolysaccharide transport system ATP-binding protein